jgi:hypothetical protein
MLRDIIKKILSEEVMSIEKFTIVEIDLPDLIFESLLNESRSTIVVSKSLMDNLKSYIKSNHNWPPGINALWCSDIREKKDQNNDVIKISCSKKFTINVSYHWAQRLFRPDEPEHQPGGRLSHLNVLYPDIYEGLKLFFDYKDSINEYIAKTTNWSSPETKKFLLTFGDYQEIVAIRKGDKGNYTVEFVTQIKGVKFFETKELKDSVRLYL